MYLIVSRQKLPDVSGVKSKAFVASARPVIHDTYAGAYEEAKRLASLSRNLEFVVFGAKVGVEAEETPLKTNGYS